jgi:methenyltetrahydromethanopterin cyclohydrolase
LFSPAWIRINNLRSGRSFVAGGLQPDVLHCSFEA